MEKIADLRKLRAVAFDAFEALADKDSLTDAEKSDYEAKKRAVVDLDGRIERAKEAQDLAGRAALPVAGQHTVAAAAESDPYVNEGAAQALGLRTHKGLRAVACAKMFYHAGRSLQGARELATEAFGENHPVTRAFSPRRDVTNRALITSVGASGGFIVPPDYMNEIIELLRPQAVVRGSGPRVIPMPRGTMTLPGQASAASAGYGSEVSVISSSQQTVKDIVASFKKLTALVPVSNDMMRYADPAADAFVRDDLVKVIALREDLAFLTGDGTAASPRGFLSFANSYALAQGGTLGVWNSGANSTFATGGNFVTSNETYTLATVAQELGACINALDTANVPETKRMWYMHPRSWNYLNNVQNSLGVYVYRDELSKGTLLGYAFRKTTQIPINLYDATGTHTDCSFVFLVEVDEAMILDSMSLELAVSREGTYVDGSGTTQSAFASDQTIVRAIAEHDFQMRHDAAVAVIQAARWAPAIS